MVWMILGYVKNLLVLLKQWIWKTEHLQQSLINNCNWPRYLKKELSGVFARAGHLIGPGCLSKKKEKRNTNKKCQAIIFIKYHKIPYKIYHKNPCFSFVQVKTGHFNRLRHLFRLGTWLSFWHLNGHLQYPEWYQINYFPFLLSTYSYH